VIKIIIYYTGLKWFKSID